jgi:Domain of unknown function (DUF397)
VPDSVAIRDSKNRGGGALIVRGAVFRDLIDSVKHGSFSS